MLQNFLILNPVSRTLFQLQICWAKKKSQHSRKILPCAWPKLKKKEGKQKRKKNIRREPEALFTVFLIVASRREQRTTLRLWAGVWGGGLCHFFRALNHHCHWMLIHSYKLLPVFTLGFLKEMHISGQQIKYITVYRNWSEASMHCIQMRPAGIQGKQKFNKLHPKNLHTKPRVRTKKSHIVSFFVHSNECDRTTSFCLSESKGLFHSGKEKHFSFLLLKLQRERVRLCALFQNHTS